MKFFCFSVIMSKKASADQISVSGSNLGPNPPRKNRFLLREGFFFGWLFIYYTVDYHLSGISLMWNFPDFEKWNLFHISGILRVRYIPY